MNARGETLTVIAQCQTEWHAEATAAALRARGIAAQAEGGYVAGWRAEAPAASRVMVFTKDLLRARLALTELRTQSHSIDWDQVDVGEHPEGVPPPVGRIAGDPAAAPDPRRTAKLLALLAAAGAVTAIIVVKAFLG